MFEILQYDFVQNALISAFIISISSGIIGTLIVVNRMVFLSGGIAHSAYGGIGIALYLGVSVTLGAALFAVAVSLLLSFLTLGNKDRSDTIIGVIWALGMAIGVIFIDLTPGYNVDMMSYLFGSILAISSNDIYFSLFMTAVIILCVTLFYRDFLSISYDQEFALTRGVKVGFMHTLLLVFSAISIVISIRVVGLILVIALLSIPVYISEKLAGSLRGMMFFSALLSCVFTVTGLFISFWLDLSAGAVIIVTASISLILFLWVLRWWSVGGSNP